MTLRLVPSPSTAEQQKSQADALDGLYDSYAADVTRWARRLVGPTADIEDLVHDVFVVAIQKAFTFRGDATIRTWLFRITHNLAANHSRRSLLRRLLFHRRCEEMVGGLQVPPTPYEEMERREDHERVYRALDHLSDKYRTALILYEIDGLPADEVAELIGVSVGTVWARVHRGRAKLLQYLNREKTP